VNLAMHNANFRGATSVSGHDFGTGHGTVRAVSHSEMQNAHFANGRLGVTPSRESYSASGRAGGVVNHAKRVAESALLLGPWRDGNGVERQVVE